MLCLPSPLTINQGSLTGVPIAMQIWPFSFQTSHSWWKSESFISHNVCFIISQGTNWSLSLSTTCWQIIVDETLLTGRIKEQGMGVEDQLSCFSAAYISMSISYQIFLWSISNFPYLSNDVFDSKFQKNPWNQDLSFYPKIPCLSTTVVSSRGNYRQNRAKGRIS